MRILQLARVYWPNIGGIEKHVQWLAEALVRRGHVCDVVTLNRSFADGSVYPPYDLLNGVNIYRVPFWGSTRYPIAPRIHRFISRYDVVHVHAIDFFADWATFSRLWHHRPVVLSSHGAFFHTGFAKGLKPVWFHTATRLLVSQVDQMLYTSEQDAELFSRITSRGRLLTQAVDLRPWKSMIPAPVSGHWVNIGRVDVHKGIADLLRTLAVVRDRDPRPFSVEVIGPEVVPGLLPELSRLRDVLGLEQRVAFRGKVPFETMQEAVRTSELGLFPAEYESFGISVVESMGAGLVPVLSDIRAFRSFVKTGENGFLTDFKQPEQAAATILRARDRVDEGMRLRARETASGYDWERVVVEVEAVYREVSAGKTC